MSDADDDDAATRKVISLNEMTDLVQAFTANRLSDLLEPLDFKQEGAIACNCRCGCLGIDCACRGQVGLVSVDEEAWLRLQLARKDHAKSLRKKLRD